MPVITDVMKLLRQIAQFIVGTAPTRIGFPQHAARQQLVDIT
jgi:hypothetical protein